MRTLFFLFVFMIPLALMAQEVPFSYNCKQISTLEGLSRNMVSAINVDTIGYCWLGTNYGLNRYDGRELTSYYEDENDEFSIPGNNIENIHVADNGSIWIVTSNGICVYDECTNGFVSMTEHGVLPQGGIIIEDDKAIRVLQESQITTIDKNDQAIVVDHIKGDPITDIVSALEFDNDHFMVLSQKHGLLLMDKKQLKFKPFFSIAEELFVDVELIDDQFYLIARNRLYIIDKNGKQREVERALLNEFRRLFLLDICYNTYNNTIWISSDGNGVFVLDKELKLLKKLNSSLGINGGLPDNSIRKVFVKDKEITLLGTVRAGLSILKNSQFKEFRNFPTAEGGLQSHAINKIIEDEDGIIWLGTDGGGLRKYDPKTEEIKNFQHPEVLKVTSMIDRQDQILMTAYLKGTFIFDKKTEQFSRAIIHPDLQDQIKNKQIMLFEDSEGSLWISGWSLLYKIDSSSGKIEEPLKDSLITDVLNSPQLYIYIFENSKGEVWFCGNQGLLCYSLKNKQFKAPILLSEYNGIGDGVLSIAQSDDGLPVFSTIKGLFEYNPITKELTPILSEKAMNNKICHTLFSHKKNQIWAGTSMGLVRVDRSDSVSTPIYFDNYGKVGGSEFRFGGIQHAQNGLLYIGNNNGFTAFNPDSVKYDESEAQVTITSLHKYGLNGIDNQSDVLVWNIKDKAHIETKFAHTSYVFQFKVFDLFNESHTQYAYQLENYEDIWHTGTAREVSYSNLQPGSYIFRVKATNRNGIMAAKTTDVYLNVLPAWYQSLWFKITSFVVVACIIILIWRESLKKARLKNQLEFEKREQYRLKELNQTKLRFYTNISHEIKTPLTLILAPLEQMMRKNTSVKEMARLFPFLYRNAQRMNHMVTQLLEFRKVESSALELNLVKADMIRDCEDVINYFKHQADLSGINLVFVAPKEELQFIYDRDKLYKILFNLISNALKNTDKEGEVIIKIEELADNAIRVVVQDSGKGIEQQKLPYVFDAFYQADNEIKGTGIGLAFTRKLVELHGGQITVKSKVGEGSEFAFILPKFDVPAKVALDESIVPEWKQHNTPLRKDRVSIEKKPLLLVVEDEWDLRQYIIEILSPDYRILEADNGKTGLEMAIEKSPDLIVTDLIMPQMNGYDLCLQVKNNIKISHVPVVLLTAKSEIEHQLKAYQLGADTYIAKPFDNAMLVSQIQALLNNRALLKERFSKDLELKPQALATTPKDGDFMQKALAVVEANIENPEFGIPDFVKGIGMSRTLVYNKTKAITGKTINEFILQVRMRKATELLKIPDLSITDIAIRCGFSDQSYFSTVFKKQFTISPSEYRKNREKGI
ncbi:MAG: ATP-binding protein [Carboxylicivirga sp.]|nr:ATP-binding protein [Carboxylicivirga sp.]